MIRAHRTNPAKLSGKGTQSRGSTYLLRVSALNHYISLVQFQPHKAINSPLTRRDSASHKFPLRCEEMPIVQDPTEFDSDKLISQRTDVPVKGETLNIHMRNTEDSSSRRLVAPSGFDADESVLDDIDTSDTMLPSKSIQSKKDFHWVRDLLILFTE